MDPKNLKKEYTNGEVTIVWQSSKCMHSGNCIRSLPGVFRPKESPWIKVDAASSDELIQAVSKCPSGALSIKDK